MTVCSLFCIIYFTALCVAQEADEDELPKLTANLSTKWLDVFPSEKVKLSCEVADSWDWIISWYRDGQPIHNDSTTSLNIDSSLLTITPSSPAYSGAYFCRGQHETKSVTTEDSNSLPLKVHDNKPKATLTQTTASDNKMYVGEPVSFSCRVDESSGWEYLWVKDGVQLQTTDQSYNVKSTNLSDSGQYSCQAKRGKDPFYTEMSETKSLQLLELPTPSVEVQTKWRDVFPSEKVKLSCEVADSWDWIISWYRDGQSIRNDSTTSLNIDSTLLTITPSSPAYSGAYYCRGQHETKSVTTEDSNSLPLKVHDNKPKATLTQTTASDNKMYVGEPVSFSCRVDESSGWEYLWVKDGVQLQTTDQSYNVKSTNLSDSGQYSCQAKRGKDPFYIEMSETKSLQLLELPTPSVKVQTKWQDVFPSERVELSCEVPDTSDWNIDWYRGARQINEDQSLSFNSERTILTIESASKAHSGNYSCKGQHKTKSVVATGDSNSLSLSVYDKNPEPALKRDPGFEQMYVGESVSLTCTVLESSGWEFHWFKDGGQLSTADRTNTYAIPSPATSDGGTYTCKATRSGSRFTTKGSEKLNLEIIYIPVPSLELRTQWLEVFPSERAELSCLVYGSSESDWTYTWSRGKRQIVANSDPDLALSPGPGPGGSSLIITSARQEHGGDYVCSGRHRARPVITESSNTVSLRVFANKPKPLTSQVPDVGRLYVGESVSLQCRVDISSGWEYFWYQDGALHPGPNSSGTLHVPSASSSNSGAFRCMAGRGETKYDTEYSEVITLYISDIPVPSLNLNTPWPEVFPTESAELSCGINESSSDWTYSWYRGGKEIHVDSSTSLGPDGGTLSIPSASNSHSGEYGCRGRHKSRSVSTKTSSGLTLKVYDKMPTVALIPAPRHEKMYVGEQLSFLCKVDGPVGWEYLWYKDGVQLPSGGKTHLILPAVSEDTGSYKCRAERGRTTMFHTNFSEALDLRVEVRPWASITLLTGWSEAFSTDSLVLQCEVKGSQDPWNFTWIKEGQELPVSSDKHIVTPNNDPDQSQYTCKGRRSARPLHSTPSQLFKTKNLLLKRRVLLAVSGCLFFGIIAVFLGCIVLRVTRKPAPSDEKPEEPNLFLTMAELKARDDAPCPLVEYITEEAMAALIKDGDGNGMICDESTPLPISPPEDQAVTSENLNTPSNDGELLSFKH